MHTHAHKHTHAIAITRLVLLLDAEANQGDYTTKTAAYADDLTAAGTIIGLRNWWETDWDINVVTLMKEANGGYLCKKKWCKKLSLFLNIYLKKDHYIGSATSWCI